jgi:hypothetical protein
VRAGGLAAKIDRLGREGAIPAPVLTENRRQLDPTEPEALALYRDGDVAGSQAIRSDAGWKHQLETPQATRQALAAAVVADADVHGTKAVAVLAARHADCEDLADRVREIRTGRGELAGRFLTGPGLGTGARRYAAGDRILLHTRFGTRTRAPPCSDRGETPARGETPSARRRCQIHIDGRNGNNGGGAGNGRYAEEHRGFEHGRRLSA